MVTLYAQRQCFALPASCHPPDLLLMSSTNLLLLFFMVVCLYATTAVYFAGVMVRLMLTLTPVVCILAAIGFSVTLDNYLVDDRPPENKDTEEEPDNGDSSSEENDKKKKKDLYDKVHVFYKVDLSF